MVWSGVHVSCTSHQLDRSRSPKMHCIHLLVGINMLITVNVQRRQTHTHACPARGQPVTPTQTRCMASLSEIARAVQISRHRLSRLHNPCSLNFLAVLALSGRLKRNFSPSISTERRRPPFDGSRPPGCGRRWRRNFAGSRGCRISLAEPFPTAGSIARRPSRIQPPAASQWPGANR